MHCLCVRVSWALLLSAPGLFMLKKAASFHTKRSGLPPPKVGIGVRTGVGFASTSGIFQGSSSFSLPQPASGGHSRHRSSSAAISRLIRHPPLGGRVYCFAGADAFAGPSTWCCLLYRIFPRLPSQNSRLERLRRLYSPLMSTRMMSLPTRTMVSQGRI